MNKTNVVPVQTQASVLAEGQLGLEELLRQGAQRMLQKAIENEVQGFLEAHSRLRTSDDRQAVVRNGSMPAPSSEIVTCKSCGATRPSIANATRPPRA